MDKQPSHFEESPELSRWWDLVDGKLREGGRETEISCR